MKYLIGIIILAIIVTCGETPNVETIKLLGFEVYPEDCQNEKPKNTMTWSEGVKACEELGEGWRLPTLKETKIMDENKDKILNLFDPHTDIGIFWCSDEGADDSGMAYRITISNAIGIETYSSLDSKKVAHRVRAVRTLK